LAASPLAGNGKIRYAGRMAENPEILDFLRERFNRLDIKLDRMAADIQDLKVRVTGIARGFAEMSAAIAGTHSRIDRVDARLDRIERRADLAELPARP
jgi:hypothetical protein